MERAPDRWLLLFVALNGLAAVGFGAFGAHGISDPQAKAWIATGAQYQLPHAVAAFTAISWRATPRGRDVAGLFTIGAAVFAGSLYAIALGGTRSFGMLAPIGGALMLGGWAWLARTGWRNGSRRAPPTP